ncbi:MAG TPA: lipid-A-disaccharide synthase [Pseudorhodoplanes sp.]|nr:lipid-A-disaccharide synthase [Pseudorhodoplanes sp.]
MSAEPLVFLVAAEESGDRLGGALMRALKAERPGVRFAGVGGRDMQAQGLQSLFPIDDLALIGLAAIPGKLPLILRRIGETVRAAIAARPDVLVIIDSPDFTHRVARRVRRRDPSIPIVDYVSPSVWAWRPGRARAMRGYVDHVLALLPFEPAVHRHLGGPPCSYVGHPLIEQISELRPGPEEAGRRLADPPVLAVLAGSRAGEIRRLMGPFAEAVALLRERIGAFDLVMPTTPFLAERVERQTRAWSVRPRIVVEARDRHAAFRAARAALAKSGTVTLELALSGVPMVAAYRTAAIEAAIARRVLRVPSVILANLVLGENVVPEFLQEDCTGPKLAEALVPLLSDTPQRRRQCEAFARLDAIMEIGKASPARRAAGIVLRHAGSRTRP